MTQNTSSDLYKKVMLLEYKLQQYMQRDNYIGGGNKKTPKSRAYLLWEECNASWKALSAQGRRLRVSGTSVTPSVQGPQVNTTVNPYS